MACEPHLLPSQSLLPVHSYLVIMIFYVEYIVAMVDLLRELGFASWGKLNHLEWLDLLLLKIG